MSRGRKECKESEDKYMIYKGEEGREEEDKTIYYICDNIDWAYGNWAYGNWTYDTTNREGEY